jgi:hypothetical protein
MKGKKPKPGQTIAKLREAEPELNLPIRGLTPRTGLPRRDPLLKTPTLEPACLFAALPKRGIPHHIPTLFLASRANADKL